MHTLERADGVETAGSERTTSTIARSLAHAPTHILRRVNEHRRAQGLPEIRVARPGPTGPGVWVRDRKTGRIVPVTSSSSRSPARPTPAAVPAVRTRVLLLPCPSFTDAPGHHIQEPLPEAIAPKAFGRADELNAERSFNLQFGHHGPKLAYAGPSLRAIDTPHGLVLEWIVDARLPMARDALQAIAAGCGVSVALKIRDCQTVRVPNPTRLVTRATLCHVALLPDDRPAYAAACAIAFPGSRPGNADELRRQIDKLVAEARFRWRRYSR